MAHWTTGEHRRLIEAHKRSIHPTRADLAVMFPRHTLSSILGTIGDLGIKHNAKQIHWLRVAHEYFSKRESEMKTLRCLNGK